MLDVVNPPSRWVESLIAASVVLAALNNLHPLLAERRWMITFAFGLVHGFGFAGALKDLGLNAGSLAGPLLGFNLGVELGQLALVALFVPLAWLLRPTVAYRRAAMLGGSSAVLHAIRRLKSRLCARGVVANPRDTSVSLRFAPNHTPKRIGFKGAVKHATLH